MGKLKRQEAASGLVGNEASEYPPELRLPNDMHMRVMHAVDETVLDGRERSIEFRYTGGIWLGGTALKGTAIRVRPNGSWAAHTSFRSFPVRAFLPAHISFHTHPIPSSEVLELSAERRGSSRGLLDQYETWEKLAALPSREDVTNWMYWSHGTLGNLLASESGVFLALKNDITSNDRRVHFDEYGAANQSDLMQKTYDRLSVPKRISTTAKSPEDIRAIYLAAISNALAPKFASYVNYDFENPNLERVN